MSSEFQPKNKRLNNISVMTSKDIWDKVGVDSKKKPIFKLKKNVLMYGRVAKGSSAYISKCNRDGKNHKYVDDFSVLNVKTKKEICNLFENENKRVVYLVRTDNKSKTNDDIKKTLKERRNK